MASLKDEIRQQKIEIENLKEKLIEEDEPINKDDEDILDQSNIKFLGPKKDLM